MNEARRYFLFKAIPLSFFSKDLYRDVGRNWPGMGFGYLFIVATMATLPLLVKMFVMSFGLTLDSPFDANYIINQIPEIRVTKGEVSLTAPQPYYIRMKETGEPIVVIDTTKPVTEWSKEFSGKSVVIIGKTDALIVNAQKNEKRLIDVPPDMTRTFDREDARSIAETCLQYAWVVPLFLALFMIPIMFISRFIQMLIYGGFGWLMAKLLKSDMGYEDCVRLACIAITPVLALDVADSLLFHFHLSVLWYFLLAMGYLGFGIRATKQ